MKPTKIILLICIFSVALVFLLFIGLSLIVFLMVDRVPIAIVMANHTDEDLIVQIESSKVNLASGGVSDLPWFRSTKARIRIQKPTGNTWDFQWKFSTPPNYSKHQRIYVQIESDAKLYVLPFEIHAPVSELPSQPPGYPLQAIQAHVDQAVK